MSPAVTLQPHARDGLEFLTDPGASAGTFVAFTNRNGGMSQDPYRSLNLAARVGDDPAAVAANRERVGGALGFDPDRLVLARQVHGAELIEVGESDGGVLGEADGLVARSPGPVLGILTADCAPVVVRGGNDVAVLHAGWRGLVAGVIEAGLAALEDPATAWIGPCIHACCYEVGGEVVDAFRRKDLPVASHDRVDPAQAAATLLERGGVSDVVVAPQCTHCDPDYFSYRRDGVTGRQGALAALVP